MTAWYYPVTYLTNYYMSRTLAILVIGFSLLISAPVAYAATLSTDKADYFPGETATIWGSLFDSMQEVVLTIVGLNEDGSEATTYSWDVTADENGSFTTFYTLLNTYVPLYLLAATEDGNVIAETSFTDANLNVTVTGGGTGNGSVTATNISCTSTAGVTSGDCAQTYGGNPATTILTATAASGSTFTGWGGACSGTGTCALSSANGVNQTATATFTLNAVVKTNQTITFGALSGKTYGDADFGVSATASSGLTVTFSTASTACTVNADGSIVHIVSAGPCDIAADQAGNASYNAAPTVHQSFTIDPADADCSSIVGYSGVYDGAAHGATGSCVGVGSDTLPVGLDLGASFTDVPGGTANWSFVNSNYNSQNSSVEIVITQAELTVTGVVAEDKVYDATTDAALDTTGAGLAGVFGLDDVTLDITGVSGTFADKNVGTDKPVTATGFAITGADAGNYSLVQPTGLTADITQKDLAVSVEAFNKIFDTTTIATVSLTTDDVILGDGVTLVYATADFALPTIGTHDVTITGIGLDGVDAGNYDMTTPETQVSSATILPYGTSTTLPPISLTKKDFQKMSSIPVKFSIASTIDGSPVSWAIATLDISTSTPGVWTPAMASGGSNTGNYFRYSTAGEQYIFNLSTKMPIFAKGNSYTLRISLNDGSVITQLINIK